MDEKTNRKQWKKWWWQCITFVVLWATMLITAWGGWCKEIGIIYTISAAIFSISVFQQNFFKVLLLFGSLMAVQGFFMLLYLF